MTDWLDDVRELIGSSGEAITEALEDLSEIVASPAKAFVHFADAPSVVIYVVAGGILHRLRGELDPKETPQDEVATRTCTYEALPINGDAAYKLTVTTKTGGNEVHEIGREWTFELGGAFGQIQVTVPPPVGDRDPTEFARALAHTIDLVRTQARGQR